VVVDADGLPVAGVPNAMSREMDFANRARRQRVQIPSRIPSVISRADIDIVDVAQNAATGMLCNVREEFPLWYGAGPLGKMTNR
jgi:hypothetical protein